MELSLDTIKAVVEIFFGLLTVAGLLVAEIAGIYLDMQEDEVLK